MKKLLIFFIILPITIQFIFSQDSNKSINENLDYFFDIKWGENPDTVRNIMSAKGFTVSNDEGSVISFGVNIDGRNVYYSIKDIFCLFFYGGKFAGEEPMIEFLFFENKFYESHVIFSGNDYRTKYRNFIPLYNEKYGKPTRTYGYTLSWNFKNSKSIILTIGDIDSYQPFKIQYFDIETNQKIDTIKRTAEEQLIIEYRNEQEQIKNDKLKDL